MGKQIGTLYGVSVGTGDPELITVKGQRLLQQVRVIAFPMGISDKPGLAEQIISPWITIEQEKLPLYFPYVQDEQQVTTSLETSCGNGWELS